MNCSGLRCIVGHNLTCGPLEKAARCTCCSDEISAFAAAVTCYRRCGDPVLCMDCAREKVAMLFEKRSVKNVDAATDHNFKASARKVRSDDHYFGADGTGPMQLSYENAMLLQSFSENMLDQAAVLDKYAQVFLQLRDLVCTEYD